MKGETALNARRCACRDFRSLIASEAPPPFPTDPRCRSVDFDQPARVKSLGCHTISGSYQVAIRYPRSTSQVTEVYQIAICCLALVYLVAIA